MGGTNLDINDTNLPKSLNYLPSVFALALIIVGYCSFIFYMKVDEWYLHLSLTIQVFFTSASLFKSLMKINI